MGKTFKYLKYTKKELDDYCKDEKSCVKCVQDQIHITMPPWGLNKFEESVRAALSKTIGDYSKTFKGIVLDAKNIKVLGNKFTMHNDVPDLHINLTAQLYIFEPHVGAVIKGILKHVAPTHISVTIYRVFNVSIRLLEKRKDLHINSEISIKITNFDLEDTMPYIEGVLDKVNEKIVFQDNDEHGNVIDSGISTEESRVSKTKIRQTSSSDSSGSETEYANAKLRIKKEQRTNSTGSSDEDDSSSDDDKKIKDSIKPVLLEKIKKEKMSSESDSETSDGSELDSKKSIKNETKIPPSGTISSSSKPKCNIKSETRSSKSSSDTDTTSDSESEENIVIKQEPIEHLSSNLSEAVANAKPVKTETKALTNRKRKLSISEKVLSKMLKKSATSSSSSSSPSSSSESEDEPQSKKKNIRSSILDKILARKFGQQEVVQKLHKKKESDVTTMKKPTDKDSSILTGSHMNKPIANISGFNSPGLSSTLKVEKKKKSKKNVT